MVENITDTKTFTITISTHGNITVSNLVAPTSIYASTPFTVTYTVTNNGGSDTCYGKMINTTTSTIIDQWQQVLANGGSKLVTVNFPTGIVAQLNTKLDVGYIT